jgi:FkbM family methyltransferase
MSRKIFLDCGANDGSSVKFFRENFPDHQEYEIYCFEPNPGIVKTFPKENGVTLINKAVYHFDGTKIFHTTNFINCTSGTLSKIKGAKYKHKVTVETIDLSKWIMKNFDPQDYIVMKLDVEGAEYRVLSKMFKDLSIKYINELYGEFHGRKVGKTKKDDQKIIDTLKSFGLVMYYWDATNKHEFNKIKYTKALDAKRISKI